MQGYNNNKGIEYQFIFFLVPRNVPTLLWIPDIERITAAG